MCLHTLSIGLTRWGYSVSGLVAAQYIMFDIVQSAVDRGLAVSSDPDICTITARVTAQLNQSPSAAAVVVALLHRTRSRDYT